VHRSDDHLDDQAGLDGVRELAALDGVRDHLLGPLVAGAPVVVADPSRVGIVAGDGEGVFEFGGRRPTLLTQVDRTQGR
jgi:hypothetical protein